MQTTQISAVEASQTTLIGKTHSDNVDCSLGCIASFQMFVVN